jgi:hypothetical protein
MEKAEWDDNQKYQVTLETLLEHHVIMMKFLEDNYGKAAIEKYYATKNELVFQTKIGTGLKMASKLIQKLSSKKFFDIFLNQLTKQAQNMIPLKCITGIDYEPKKAVIHIDKCVSKRLFRQNLKKFKVQDQISDTAFCEFNCIPSFQTYGRIGAIKISAIFKEKGCDITAEVPEESSSSSESK